MDARQMDQNNPTLVTSTIFNTMQVLRGKLQTFYK